MPGPQVGELLEVLARVAPAGPVRSLRQGSQAEALRTARTVTTTSPAASASRLGALRYCVDWSEQRHHLSGATGRALAARLLELKWIRRADSGRAVFVTDLGRREFPSAFGVTRAHGAF